MNKNDNTKSDIDPTSQKVISTITSFFTYFSVVIILFLILSYVGNQYIPGIGLMFLPMWITNGESFYKKPCLGSLFHKPSQDLPKSDFIKEENGIKKYRLLEMGPSFYEAIGGIFNRTLSETPEINEVDIVLQDYDDKLNPFQKFVLIIFGSLQMFIGSLMTLFSSVAYLFSGKHGLFFNTPFEREKNQNKNKSYQLFNSLDESIRKTDSDKILIKSGWSKFAAAFGFAYFIPVDKLTYGTQFYITERSSFIQRFQYFFFIMLIMLFIGTLPSSFQGGTSGIAFGIIFAMIMYTLFAKRMFNEKYQTEPYPNMTSLLDKYKRDYLETQQNKKNMETKSKTNKYNGKNDKDVYDILHTEIVEIKKKLTESLKKYQEAYKIPDRGLTVDEEKFKDHPLTKAENKVKKSIVIIGDGISKIKEKFKSKNAKTNNNIQSKSPKNQKND